MVTPRELGGLEGDVVEEGGELPGARLGLIEDIQKLWLGRACSDLLLTSCSLCSLAVFIAVDGPGLDSVHTAGQGVDGRYGGGVRAFLW